MIIKADTKWDLWNLNDNFKKTRITDTASTESMKLSEAVMAGLKENMTAPWSLLPFDNISDIPGNAKWQQVTEKDINNKIPNTHVYELIWSQKRLLGKILYKRWRGFIDIDTRLPHRTEYWERSDIEEEYELLVVTKVSYPATADIQVVIDASGL